MAGTAENSRWHKRDGEAGKTPGRDEQGRNAEKGQALSTSPGFAGEGRRQKARNCQEFSREKDSTAEGDESQGDFTQVKAQRG